MSRAATKYSWMEALKPISGTIRTTLSQRIYEALLEAILTGKLGPGEHLVEQKLADHFGVSRMAVREAVRRLASDGLVEAVPNRGMFTQEFGRRDIEEIFSLRAHLECLAVRILTDRRRRADFAALADVLDAMEEVEHTEDRITAAMLDMRFHRSLVEGSRHSRMIRVWNNMRAQITMVIYNSSTYYPDTGDLADRHRAILLPMQEGDTAAAIDAIFHHIEDAGEYLLACLAEDAEHTA